MVTIEEINQAINERAPGSWVAGENAVWRRGVSAGDSKNLLFGLRMGDEDQRLRTAAESIFDELTAQPAPSSIDWRTNTGGIVTPVKNQGRCGACVAFATCAAMESAEAIRTAAVTPPLSEGHLFHCNGGSCVNGWGFVQALEAAKSGVGRVRRRARFPGRFPRAFA